jgi:hypothetical protein
VHTADATLATHVTTDPLKGLLDDQNSTPLI